MTGSSPDYDFLAKTLIIGDQAIGKSALMLRYCDTSFSSDYICTIGVEARVKTVEVDGKRGKIQIWDTAGQERFRVITQSFYRGARGIVLCYAINNRESFEKLEYWMEEIRKYASYEISVVLVGMKSDLSNERAVSFDEGGQFADSHGLKFFEASAKENVNIDKVFLELTRGISSSICDWKGEAQIKLRGDDSQAKISCFKCS